MATIKRCTWDELSSYPQFAALADGYRQEAANRRLPASDLQHEWYQRADAAGLLSIFAVLADEALVGFAIVLTPCVPHYGGIKIAITESIYVHPAHRLNGVGVRLIRALEAFAKDREAVGLYISAPHEGKLEGVLPRLGYTETVRTFFKAVGDDSIHCPAVQP